ncbi:MAG: DUF4435 domain-containing protein [Bacteroidales bacterium]|nr:DUF4435 domain-containing protein [Bacteroidales bacterium]
MNIDSKPRYSDEEKYNFYKLAAKRFKAELKLQRADVAIHLENKNDELFWGKLLRHFFPDKKFRFITASRSLGGNITCGCTQCLHYKDFLNNRFWIAIDSDYRYLNQQADIDAQHFILQTYTYSFENHFCFTANVNQAEMEACGELKIDFEEFLRDYSRIIYPLFVWQLYLQGVDPEAFPQRVFHRLLTLPIGSRATEKNGASILQLLKERVHKLETHFRRKYPEADPTWHEARCQTLGVHRDNCYLFVRGHQLYDLVTNLGRRIRQEIKKGPEFRETRNFESCLTGHLCFGQYDEIRRIVDDANQLLGSARSAS